MASTPSTQRPYTGVRFFNSGLNYRPPGAQSTNTAVWVNVGEYDSAFRALAAAVIDRTLSDQSIPEEVLKTLLSKHFKLFPDQKAGNHGLLTVSERMQQLLKQVSLSVLLQTLAFTLRQIAVDELCREPETYPLAFVNGNRPKSLSVMRHPETHLGEHAIVALSHALNCAIQVSVVEPDKSLPLKIRYDGQTNVTLSLQRQGDVYMPYLKQTERFKQALQYTRNVELEHLIENEEEIDVKQLIQRAGQEIEQIYTTYHHTSNNLKVMFDARELTQDDLLAIYLACIQPESNTMKYSGTEYGNQAFFTAISAARSGTMPVAESPRINQNAELIHGIAMAVSFEQTSLEAAFEVLEQQQPEARVGHRM
ncbi:OTU domain-containing protein [Legionella yabuuchiae]|uniref:OTU domain-containing protein n=1 Tax=Legionella yabuuchiae TaxID=376727 RepID=UPI0010541454|nr:OTU domain-containing protein [Legionella yabuuchiae]